MDAITLLKSDHKAVAKLFREYKSARPARRSKIVARVIEELSIHAAIEEQVFYPAVREEVPDLEDDILESFEEHHVLKWTLAELSAIGPDDERYDAKVTVMMEQVRHHVAEEEGDWFPESTSGALPDPPERARCRAGDGEEACAAHAEARPGRAPIALTRWALETLMGE